MKDAISPTSIVEDFTKIDIPHLNHFKLNTILSKDFVFAWGNFVSTIKAFDSISLNTTIVSLGVNHYNLSVGLILDLILAYNEKGLVGLNNFITSSETLYSFSPSGVTGNYTSEGKLLFDYFKCLDNHLDVVNTELMSRVDEWSIGRKDKYLDDVSDMLKKMVND